MTALPTVAGLSFALATLAGFADLPAQDRTDTAPAPQKKTYGKLFKSPVDGLINGLTGAARTGGTKALGPTCRDTARILTAMGHSHRFYALTDGPVVRDAVLTLFERRQADGSFRNDASDDGVATTRWVAAALHVLDPKAHADDLAQTRSWLRSNGGDDSDPFAALVATLLEQTARGGPGPDEQGAEAAGRAARGPLRTAAGAIDFAATIDTLLRLVACQTAARRLDRGEAKGPAEFTTSQQRAIDFLLTQQENGVFLYRTPQGAFPDVGTTGLGIAALLTKPEGRRTETERDVIEKGLAFLAKAQNDDGSFGQQVVNYTTCAVILALANSGRAEFQPLLDKAQHWIVGIQNAEDRGYARSDRDYGSIGYGGDQRGDLSNLQFAVEALRKSGLEADHESFAKALVFLQRTQNLKAVNDFGGQRMRDENGDWYETSSGDDGGSAYYPGNSPAGYVELPDGTKVPRSYGSMTYAMLKTYTLCGLSNDDPRVAAAVDWISRNWTLDENPGSSPMLPRKARYQGLYYYYMVAAQALDLLKVDTLKTTDGDAAREIDWRADLRAHLAKLQSEDGSWVNEKNGRWWESQATICTIYSLLALDRCRTPR